MSKALSLVISLAGIFFGVVCGAACPSGRAAACGAAYPMPSNFHVRYFDENGIYVTECEYKCNYPSIDKKSAAKIIAALKKDELSDGKSLCSLYDGLEASVSEFERAYGYAPINAEVVFFADAPNNKFKYNEGAYGRMLDVDSLILDLKKNAGAKLADIRLKTAPVAPEFTVKKLKEITKKRSGFATGYSQSKPYRKENIEVAAGYLNGATIASGAVFSFNERVGKRTEERGFKPAPVLLNGKQVEDIGGGVCQVSTTLYNAALYAGLEIAYAKRHSSKVAYIKPSFDAMVSEYNDLKIKNNTDYPVYISAHADGSRLKIEFFGEAIKNDLEIKLRSEVLDTVYHIDEFIEDDGSYGLLDGESLRLYNGSDGCASEGYIDYYQNGELVLSKRIRQDKYKPLNGVVVLPKLALIPEVNLIYYQGSVNKSLSPTIAAYPATDDTPANVEEPTDVIRSSPPLAYSPKPQLLHF